ncbi:TAFII55 protein conserved region-domain-containing protein [Bombardia bombarda]|uniref:TAFII55 protein conserved region-domain-containing protein n=1 Tax=Bombardia bombarda TaxID=252184 RepID=A0AA39XBD4_9PEZI|nr:TAFII55 protein conserved region-domain-containing protein [Bombardia bombarda]
MSPTPQTPSGGPLKIKLLARKSLPSTPADTTPQNYFPRPSPHPTGEGGPATPGIPKITKIKAGKPGKPPTKKRIKMEDDDDDEVPLANGTSQEPKRKKPKITLIKTPNVTKPPTLKVKKSGNVPLRPLGEGYDSEAEDRELDPVIEEQFLFRMMPGEHCDYLSKAIKEKKVGIPPSQGGADVQFKFLDEDGRRVMFTIQGQPYAAILLDLPTITEGMKTWDKKAMVKSADICQMILVFAKVRNEEEARNAPLPKPVDHGHRWPHGITPPMHDARNRRFRKRLSKLEIQNKEAEVDRLLAADKDAVHSKFEFVDDSVPVAPVGTAPAESGEEGEEEDGEADGEGEMDYFGDAEADQHDDSALYDDAALEAEFMTAMETPAETTDVATPAFGGDAVTPGTANTGTPAAQTEDEGQAAESDSGESESESENSGNDGEVDGDDNGDDGRHDNVASIRNEIAAYKKKLAGLEEQYAKMVQPMMKKRLMDQITGIKAELSLKMSSIGEADED